MTWCQYTVLEKLTSFADGLVTAWHTESVESKLITRGTSKLDGNFFNGERSGIDVSCTEATHSMHRSYSAISAGSNAIAMVDGGSLLWSARG